MQSNWFLFPSWISQKLCPLYRLNLLVDQPYHNFPMINLCNYFYMTKRSTLVGVYRRLSIETAFLTAQVFLVKRRPHKTISLQLAPSSVKN
jgi:hypothetical protein